jgi:hypothetical protein
LSADFRGEEVGNRAERQQSEVADRQGDEDTPEDEHERAEWVVQRDVEELPGHVQNALEQLSDEHIRVFCPAILVCVYPVDMPRSVTAKGPALSPSRMDDTSLDDFLASESEDDADDASPDEQADASDSSAPAAADDDGGNGGSPESDAERTEPTDDQQAADSVAPATTTSRWVEGGADCAVCESAAERLWESADGLVCATCKEW